MIYILQDSSESDVMSVEIEELRGELKNSQYDSENELITVRSGYFTDIPKCNGNGYDWLKNKSIPVGTIEFVQAYLKTVYNIDHMSPTEVPTCLRLPHLLLREYRIVPYDKLPRSGNYFVKDVSKLKSWTYLGSMEYLFSPSFDQSDIDESHLFQVSDILQIISEYRVIVIENRIFGIQFYDGDPTVMPTPKEINKIKEMVIRYSMSNDCPKAYAMDVAVVRADNEQGRDLALIEIVPTVSIGTYGCRGPFLPRMYELGIRWYIEHNTPIQETE